MFRFLELKRLDMNHTHVRICIFFAVAFFIAIVVLKMSDIGMHMHFQEMNSISNSRN